jgi:hypothetical protein
MVNRGCLFFIAASAVWSSSACWAGSSRESGPGLDNLVLTPPTITKLAHGVVFRGAVCLRGADPVSAAADIDIAVVGTTNLPPAHGRIDPLRDRTRRCGFYTVKADWPVAPMASLRLCVIEASRPSTEGSCRTVVAQ